MSGGVDFADPFGAGVRDVQVAVRIHGDSLHNGEGRACGGSAIADITPGAGQPAAGDRRDGGAGNLTHAVVEGIDDVDVAVGIDGDATGAVELRAAGRSVGATRPGLPVAGDGRDHAARDLADAAIPGVHDEEVAGRIERDALGIVQLRAGRQAAIAAVAGRAVARHDREEAGGGAHFDDTILIHEKDVPGGIGRQKGGCVNAETGGLPGNVRWRSRADRSGDGVGLADRQSRAKRHKQRSCRSHTATWVSTYFFQASLPEPVSSTHIGFRDASSVSGWERSTAADEFDVTERK